MKENKIYIEVTENDLIELEAHFIRSQCVCSPDRYQFLQNELNKEIASMLLRSWKISKFKKYDSNTI
jgi:hypothetical protein